MNRQFQTILCLAILTTFSRPVSADIATSLEDLVGYTVLSKKTIEGWYDKNEDDDSMNDTFEGCDHGRVIVFTDNKTLRCADTGYQSVYRPTAVILSNGSKYKMAVGDAIYDMRR